MKTKSILRTFAIVCLLSIQSLFAQEPTFEWAKQMGGTDYDFAFSITVDVSGNVFTTGRFNGTVDFDPGAETVSLTSAGWYDIFVQKLDSNGDFLWAKQMGGTGYDVGNSIAVNASGSVYTVGYFNGTADFDPGADSAMLTSVGSKDIFVQKLDSNGDFLWAKQMGGSYYNHGKSVALDTSGNIYIIGYFNYTADFDQGAVTLTSVGNVDIFIQKLDSNGNFLWVKQMGGSLNDYGKSITLDSYGNIYTSGQFSTTVDFNPGVGTDMLTSAGGADIFVQKLDSNGDFLWAKQIEGTENNVNNSIAVDSFGNIFTTGHFNGTADFDPGPGIANLTVVGEQNVFVQKLDSLGNFLWAKQLGATGSNIGKSIVADASGNVYTTGHFEGTIDFDSGGGDFMLTSAGGADIFIQKLDINGDFLWAMQMGGTTHDVGYSIIIDASGNIYTAGSFSGTGDYDPGNGTTMLTSVGFSDIFVQKLSQCIPIIPIDITTFLSGLTITANNVNGTYQWLDCDNNFAALSGEDDQSFTATVNGNYAVEITDNGCMATSACVSITTVGLIEFERNVKLLLYPNPSTGTYNIQFEKTMEHVVLTICDLQGRLISTTEIQNSSNASLTLNESPGIYLLTIKTKEGQKTLQLIKE